MPSSSPSATAVSACSRAVEASPRSASTRAHQKRERARFAREACGARTWTRRQFKVGVVGPSERGGDHREPEVVGVSDCLPAPVERAREGSQVLVEVVEDFRGWPEVVGAPICTAGPRTGGRAERWRSRCPRAIRSAGGLAELDRTHECRSTERSSGCWPVDFARPSSISAPSRRYGALQTGSLVQPNRRRRRGWRSRRCRRGGRSRPSGW